MGQARARGNYEQRKAGAITAGEKAAAERAARYLERMLAEREAAASVPVIVPTAAQGNRHPGLNARTVMALAFGVGVGGL